MKRTVLFVMIFSCILAFVTAQDGNRREQRRGHGQPQSREHHRGNRPNAESVNISGNLTLVRGRIAVISNDLTYFAVGLNRYVGFIDGLKDGAAVTLQGNAFPVPQNEKARFLQVQKLTLAGKDYDLNQQRRNVNPEQFRHMQQQFMRHQTQCCRHCCMPQQQNPRFNQNNNPWHNQSRQHQQQMRMHKR